MKKILFICLLSCSVISGMTHAKPAGEPLDKTVAIVNDDIVSRSELNKALETAKMQLAQENVSQPPANVLQKQVLDKLINKKIQLQIAQQAGVEITDAELNETIGRIAKQNHMAVSELYERINQDGMTTQEYRSEMREQMLMQKLQQHEVASRITITQQEINNFKNSPMWKKNGTKEYHLQDILIPLSEAPTPEEIISAKGHADDLMIKIHQGQDFDQIAVAESGGGQALQGGDLGWRKLPEIPAAFADQVAKMQPKTVAGPIQTPNGFHIIRLVESRTLTGKQADTSRKMIESLLMQQKFEEAVQNWVSKLRSQAFVVINA